MADTVARIRFGVSCCSALAAAPIGTAAEAKKTTKAAAAGQVQWVVPPTTTLAGDYVVRVVSVAETAVFDDSDAPFTIWNPFKTYLPLLLK